MLRTENVYVFFDCMSCRIGLSKPEDKDNGILLIISCKSWKKFSTINSNPLLTTCLTEDYYCI